MPSGLFPYFCPNKSGIIPSFKGATMLSLRSAVEDLLITGRPLKRSVIKVCSDTGITDGSVRAFVVTSKDDQKV